MLRGSKGVGVCLVDGELGGRSVRFTMFDSKDFGLADETLTAQQYPHLLTQRMIFEPTSSLCFYQADCCCPALAADERARALFVRGLDLVAEYGLELGY